MSRTAPSIASSMPRTRGRQRERGLSLVELLVAMVIGLFLIGGVASVFVANQQSAAAKGNFDNSQEALRFMAATVGRIVRLGTAVESTSTASQLVLTYPGGAGIKDCLGNFVAAGSLQTDIFTRSGTELRCNGTTLLDGLAALSFGYGVDANGNNWIEAGEYVAAPADWDAVNSVRVTATLANGVAHTFTGTLRPKIVALHAGAQPPAPPEEPESDPDDGGSDVPVDPGEGDGDQETSPPPPPPPPPEVTEPPVVPTTCLNTVSGTTGQYNVTTSPAGASACTYSGNGSNRTFLCRDISAMQGSTITVLGTRSNGATRYGTVTANCGSQAVATWSQ